MNRKHEKQVNRKELLQLAFFKLVKQGDEPVALCLADKMISSEHRGSTYVHFADREEELEIIKTINLFLEDRHFEDICNLNHRGIYKFNLEGRDVTINTKRYEEYK